jgi:hypothetical protein
LVLIIIIKLFKIDMSSPVLAGSDAELWGIDGSIVLYGLLCDIMLIVPLVIYLVQPDGSDTKEYHQTYINMLYSAYAPLGITWWIVLADDSQAARTALSSAIEMAGLGPFALLWVGMATYLMAAKSGSFLNQVYVWVWAIVYPVINILLIVMHYHLSPPMYAWLEKAPLRQNPIDDPTPWAAPQGTVSGKAGGRIITDNKSNIVNISKTNFSL